MIRSRWPCLWRIGSTAALLDNGNFAALGLPPVTVADYREYTTKNPKSQGALTRQGYKNITILWNEMDGLQLKTLVTVVEAAITAGTVYLTIDRANGTGVRDDFIDVSGIVQPVEYQPLQRGDGWIFTNVTLTATNLTVDSDPSTIAC